VSEPTTKHHQLATTGHVEGYKKGGKAEHHGHKSVEHHHPAKHHGGHKEMAHREHHAEGGKAGGMMGGDGCGTPGGSRSKY
jgi:hypothetical protein